MSPVLSLLLLFSANQVTAGSPLPAGRPLCFPEHKVILTLFKVNGKGELDAKV